MKQTWWSKLEELVRYLFLHYESCSFHLILLHLHTCAKPLNLIFWYEVSTLNISILFLKVGEIVFDIKFWDVIESRPINVEMKLRWRSSIKMFSQIRLYISYETEKQSKHPSMLLATYLLELMLNFLWFYLFILNLGELLH